MKPRTIIYFFDPLCITCFSFAPVIKEFKKKYSTSFEFDLITGGMVRGKRVGPVSQKADYLRKKIEAIENAYNIKFGDPFKTLLDEGSYLSDSFPPSVAINVFKSIRPDQIFELAHAIQKAHYLEGKDLNNIKVYLRIAEKFMINKRAFMDRYNDPLFENITMDSFELTEKRGVDHFPSLMVENGKEKRIIFQGYISFEDLTSRVEDIVPSAGGS